MTAMLKLDCFGAAFGDKVVLNEVSFDVPEKGVFVLLGPCGTGKSTLLRSLSGLNDANPSFRTWGEVYYCGRPLDDENRPPLVGQSVRLMMSSVLENLMHHLPERNNLDRSQQRELARRLLNQAGMDELFDKLDENVMSLTLVQQRFIAIARLIAAGPRMICIDEPTSSLDDDDADRLLEYIHNESRRRAMLVVLHNLKHARRLGGNLALLAGGNIQEIQTTHGFIDTPQSTPGKQWISSGSCCVAMPGTPVEELGDDVSPPPPLTERARFAPSESYGPRGFLWLKPGELAGTPLPGVFHDIEFDMKLLNKVGVTTLMTLTSRPLDEQVLAAFSVKSIWEPIKDMGAPDMEQAVRICRRIDDEIDQGEVVAVHCRAGLGRTGTMLAAHLIWHGADALDALETVRGVEPRWVQSEQQVAFLQAFDDFLKQADTAQAAEPWR